MVWSFDNNLPIYTQLISHIKLAIASGELLPGDRLSTVRELAAEAGVNPNTMQRAFQELEREGLVFSQRSSGRFVTEDTAVIDNVKLSLAEQNTDAFLTAMKRLGYEKKEIIKLLESRETEEKK